MALPRKADKKSRNEIVQTGKPITVIIIAIRTVRTSCITPNHTGQIGTSQIGKGQVGFA